MIPRSPRRWSGCVGHINRTHFKHLALPSRNFSRAAPFDSLRPLGIAKSNSVTGLLRPRSPLSSRSLLPVQALRFGSTNLPSLTDSQAASTSDAGVLADTTHQSISTPLDQVVAASPSAVTEHIGYLKELGLDYGWGPTAMVEFLLEHVHVYAGTPWWGSILLTALLIRLTLLKAYINASDTSARVAVLQPLLKPAKARLDAAQAIQDVEAVKLAGMEMRNIYLSNNIKLHRMFVPMLQAPIGYGTFRLLRGMSALPVPGFDNGGLLWMTDLTLPDPFFILPVGTGLAFHWVFKSGGELGSNALTGAVMQKMLLYVFPGLTTLFMLGMPASLQISFALTSLLSLVQSYFLRQPWFRSFLGIQPIIQPTNPTESHSPKSPYPGTMTIYRPPQAIPTEVSAPPPKGLLGGAISEIKGAASELMKTARRIRGASESKGGTRKRTAAELKAAMAYEERRKKEMEQKLPSGGRKRRNR